ncbi:hypothetical protein AB0M95_31890 [Sphaerisporangium sp. NPDC051017]|uniref:hypothetical protein n=1 Tax=Sphaerisporangium sp. NPDC051017 TaxID=3154636 RepID=UPI00342C951C
MDAEIGAAGQEIRAQGPSSLVVTVTQAPEPSNRLGVDGAQPLSQALDFPS